MVWQNSAKCFKSGPKVVGKCSKSGHKVLQKWSRKCSKSACKVVKEVVGDSKVLKKCFQSASESVNQGLEHQVCVNSEGLAQVMHTPEKSAKAFVDRFKCTSTCLSGCWPFLNHFLTTSSRFDQGLTTFQALFHYLFDHFSTTLFTTFSALFKHSLHYFLSTSTKQCKRTFWPLFDHFLLFADFPVRLRPRHYKIRFFGPLDLFFDNSFFVHVKDDDRLEGFLLAKSDDSNRKKISTTSWVVLAHFQRNSDFRGNLRNTSTIFRNFENSAKNHRLFFGYGEETRKTIFWVKNNK